MIAAAVLVLSLAAHQPFYDRTHTSKVLGEERHYRIFLPSDYESDRKHYPVIYYFHGHSDRYTLEHYDKGTDTVPKIAAFVAAHDVIVVAVDGYVAAHYTGFYGGWPWDLRQDGGDHDFGAYFRELVTHVDSSYRTRTSRRYRATSGLSMGGFMSLWLSARYPDLVGSASAFNPAPELWAGEKGQRVLWRLRDHSRNHGRTMVRLVRASGDYISQYHEELRDAYSRSAVDFEFRQDEYHRHWATSIAETFAFHLRAFGTPALDNVPEVWSHADAYRSFSVAGYHVESSGETPGITYLEDVTQGGFRITTRRWAPDGPAVVECKIVVTTPARYSPGASYVLLDHSLRSGITEKKPVTAGPDGRITVTVDGGGHQVSFAGPGTGAQPPVLLPLSRLRFPPREEVALPIRIYNPRNEPMKDVRLELSSDYPTVELIAGKAATDIAAGSVVDLAERLRARFTAGGAHFAPARLQLKLIYDGWHTSSKNIDVLVIPESLAEAVEVQILDGRTLTLAVFRQKGNQGGGASISRTVTEGKGNGNGVLEPGEEATFWVRMRQGMDPFDRNNWYRARVHSDSRWLTEVACFEEEKQREWTGARERTSLIHLSADAPAATIPLVLENETWSFHYTPDVRYGKEPLYQAFQLHTRHLHRYELRIGR